MSNRELDRLSVIERLEGRALKQKDAARLLGLTVRQVRRLQRRFEAQGARGLVSRSRGQPGNRRLADPLRKQIVEIIKAQYPDFGPTLATEKLLERHDIHASVETVRQLMISHGLWAPRERRLIVHKPRPRRPCFGEMIQVDGSLHAWFEDRGPVCTLVVFIDDATGSVVAARFFPRETTAAYMALLRAHVEDCGRPVSIYSDCHAIFRSTAKERRDLHALTQFGRVLEQLDIEAIHALSPQAKGRVERVNRTFQDRLVKELRLEHIATIEAANAFLPRYLASFNARFARLPMINIDAHRPLLHSAGQLDLLFTRQFERKITRSLTVQYNNTVYVLKAYDTAKRLINKRVTVCVHANDQISLVMDGKTLAFDVLAQGQPKPPRVDDKQLNAVVDEAVARRGEASSKPVPEHPWRKFRYGSITRQQQRERHRTSG